MSIKRKIGLRSYRGRPGGLVEGTGSCSGCASQLEIGKMKGNWQDFILKFSAEILRNIEDSVLGVIAELPEAASRKYPEAKHWRRAGI